jgi:uncharacterized membrane-anchored protein YitT (DUF2179 family)
MLKTFFDIITGRILYKDFWRKHTLFLFSFFVAIFVMIVFSYYGDLKIAQINTKKQKIEKLREKSLYLEATLMQMSLESMVYEQVKERKLGLVKPNEPILIIKTTANERQR